MDIFGLKKSLVIPIEGLSEEVVGEILAKSNNVLLRTEIRGDKRIYFYQQPDGSIKEVYHSMPKGGGQQQQQSPEQSGGAGAPQRNAEPDQGGRHYKPKAPDGINLAISESRKRSMVMFKHLPPHHSWNQVGEDDSVTGIPLKWEVYHCESQPELEMVSMRGKKMSVNIIAKRGSVLEANMYVLNMEKGKTVYKRHLSLPEQAVKDPERFLPQMSFLRHHLDSIGSKVGSLQADTPLKYLKGLSELRYFPKADSKL
jgi:hypothetical protein